MRTKDLRLPGPDDDFEKATTKAITFNDLEQPTEQELRTSFQALLDIVVARDSISTRADVQLDQLCNLLLLKLESDTNGSLRPDRPVSFQLRADEEATGKHIRDQFDQLVEQREEIFREEHAPELMLDDHTIKEVVYAWQPVARQVLKDDPDLSGCELIRLGRAANPLHLTPTETVALAAYLTPDDLERADWTQRLAEDPFTPPSGQDYRPPHASSPDGH